jgi:hypothetical protein
MVWRGGQQPGAASHRTGNVTGVVIQLYRQRSIKRASQVSKNQHGSRDERSSRKLQPRGGNLGDRGGILHLGHRDDLHDLVHHRFTNRRSSNRRFSNRRTRDRQERRALHESIDVHMSVYSIVCIRFPWAHRPTSSVKLSQARSSSVKLSQAQSRARAADVPGPTCRTRRSQACPPPTSSGSIPCTQDRCSHTQNPQVEYPGQKPGQKGRKGRRWSSLFVIVSRRVRCRSERSVRVARAEWQKWWLSSIYYV